MVDELKFDDEKSPWESHVKDPAAYVKWAEGKKGKERISYPHVTGRGKEIREGTTVPVKAAK